MDVHYWAAMGVSIIHMKAKEVNRHILLANIELMDRVDILGRRTIYIEE